LTAHENPAAAENEGSPPVMWWGNGHRVSPG
jgi:hypothetical protein